MLLHNNVYGIMVYLRHSKNQSGTGACVSRVVEVLRVG